MARQGSQSQSHRDLKARVVLRVSLLVSIWIFTASMPDRVCAQDQATESAVGSMSAVESLRVQTKRISLVSGTSLRIVQANEKMPWVFNIQTTVDSDEAGTARDPLTLRYSIHRVDLGHRVLSGQREIIAIEPEQSQAVSLDDRAPTEEGVYEVRFQLVRRSDKLWARLRPKEIVLEELRVPMLVQSPPSGVAAHSTPWQTVGEIRPSDTAMALGQWLPDSAARLIPGVRYVKGNLQKGEAHGKSVSIVQPKSVFQAKLPIMATGYPHRITIRCPRDQASGLRIDLGHGADQTQSRFSSLIQSSDASRFLQQTAYHQAGNPSARSDDQWLTRTFLYYPQPDDQVWLTNLNETSAVSFESIEVTAGPATQMNLTQRQAVANQTMREIVLSISDPTWTLAMSDDWQVADESALCDPRSVELHRVWIAAHRVVEQAQQIGASSLAIPVFSSNPLPDHQVADKESVALHVFDRFDIAVKASVSLKNNQAGALGQMVERFSNFHCFDGLVITLDPTLPERTDELIDLKRVCRGKRLLVQSSSGRLTENVREAIASIQGAVLVAMVDSSRSVRPSNDFTLTGSTGTTGVALVDCPIARQDPAACLFEIINRFNPSVVIIDEPVARGLVDDQMLRTCKSYESLPANSMLEIASSDPGNGTCRVKHALVEGRALISLSNLAPWDSVVKLESVEGSMRSHNRPSLLSDSVLWERIDDGSFHSTNGSQLIHGLIVPARDTVLLRSRFPVPQGWQDDAERWRWNATVAGGDSVVDEIKKNVTGIVERMGMLSDPMANDQLNNGSFEVVGEMGLVGWMHAQHPPGCVMVDSDEASDGNRSVRLTTDRVISARTWLVSDTITAPVSGRLAVSMALRGRSFSEEGQSSSETLLNQGSQSNQAARIGIESQPNQKMLHLRVSLEGTQSGVPMRESADVEVPHSGKWQPRRIVLEVDSIDPNTIDSLRLTIDSMTPGLVWVDDIRLHDEFSTTRERTDLQTQAFLAVEGLQRGNLTPSAKLLMNRWASRLLEQSKLAAEPSEKPSLSSDAGRDSARNPFSAEVPEVANRNRGWLLERLRF